MKTNKYRLQSLRIALFSASILLAAGCSGSKEEKAGPAHEEHHHEEEGTVELSAIQYRSVGIGLGAVQPRQLTGLLKVNGLLDVPPQNQVSISVPFGGILKDTDLLQGKWVNKGEVIARMEHPDYIQMQHDYVDAQSQLGYLESEYKRQQELSRENVSAMKTFQKAEADYQSTRSRVEALKQKLSLLNIRAENILKTGILRSIPVVSPISGYVTEVNANIGKFVQPNEVIFEIVDTRHLHVELMVFEKDVPKVREGQQVRFILANESKERLAEVHLIGREISPERTVRVHCHLEQEDKNLLPGMYLKATIETGASQTDALPNEAVVNNGGKYYFFTQLAGEEAHQPSGKEAEADTHEDDEQHGYRFQAVEVGVGVTDNGYTEVILPEGFDRSARNIVLKGAYDLLSAMNNSEEEGHSH
ncbi:efflux RND transporter periplasmic adaptor subunit [Dawidia soli]|uniref:Efflux RND transporter periplasmic adaptor subunit n=1 Tax=Dawidia soli TaxID=2782352 RepID=A0AAP2GBE7_9BACT|nr:efflux RND transporter periplasmic adaptor subunit [Dawidia soli]MBT1684967.1 efflux RND transporter periplasmic adaptor subunit [Dawidia soli]